MSPTSRQIPIGGSGGRGRVRPVELYAAAALQAFLANHHKVGERACRNKDECVREAADIARRMVAEMRK